MTATKQEIERSATYKVIDLIYRKSWSDGGKSFLRLNSALQLGLRAVIIAGLTFEENDFKSIASDFNGGYWLAVDNGKNYGESYYAAAVENNNLSACQSFENWKNRKPFVLHGKRIFIGHNFVWIDAAGKRWNLKCTSFDSSGEYLTACAYEWLPNSISKYGTQKISKRFNISQEELKKQRALLKPKKEKVAA